MATDAATHLSRMIRCVQIADIWCYAVLYYAGAGSKVRGVSGGQRRRVSLGRGISAGAQILFCGSFTIDRVSYGFVCQLTYGLYVFR